MHFFNKSLAKIYKYIYIHDDETILIQDICNATALSKPTVHKYIKWLLRRKLIKKDGKHFNILPT